MKVNDENMTLLKSLQKSHKSTTNVGATNKRAASNDASTPSIKGRRKDPNSNSLTSSTQNAPEVQCPSIVNVPLEDAHIFCAFLF